MLYGMFPTFKRSFLFVIAMNNVAYLFETVLEFLYCLQVLEAEMILDFIAQSTYVYGKHSYCEQPI